MRMSSDMSEPLSDKPDGTNPNAQVNKPANQQENVLIRRPFSFQESVTPVPSWPACGRLALAV